MHYGCASKKKRFLRLSLCVTVCACAYVLNRNLFFYSFSSFLFIQIFFIYLFLLLLLPFYMGALYLLFSVSFFCEGGEKAEMDFYNADKIDQYRCCFVLFVSFFFSVCASLFCCYFAINFARRQCWPSLVSTGVDWVYIWVCVRLFDRRTELPIYYKTSLYPFNVFKHTKTVCITIFPTCFFDPSVSNRNEIITHLYEQWWWCW